MKILSMNGHSLVGLALGMLAVGNREGVLRRTIAPVGALPLLFLASMVGAQTPTLSNPQVPAPERPLRIQLDPALSWPLRVQLEKEPETDWVNLKCGDAKSHDEADLCEQKRMAEAAEQTVQLTKLQYLISDKMLYLAYWQTFSSLAGFCALLLSLWFVWRSTSAALNAAQAAAEAVEVARDNSQRQLRAYVSVVGTAISEFGARTQPTGTITALNAGQTPANDVRVSICVATLKRDNEDFEVIVQRQSSGPLAAGEKLEAWHQCETKITGAEYDAIQRNDKLLFMFGRITYRDVFGNSHAVSFRYQLYWNPEEGWRWQVCEAGNHQT